MALIDWNSDVGRRVLRKMLKTSAFAPERVSLGWVNTYMRKPDGKLQMSSMPYRTKEDALKSRSQYPSGTYLDTIELFARRP